MSSRGGRGGSRLSGDGGDRGSEDPSTPPPPTPPLASVANGGEQAGTAGQLSSTVVERDVSEAQKTAAWILGGLGPKTKKDDVLKKEKGQFHELFQLQKSKGKPFIAKLDGLVPEAEALAVPPMPPLETLIEGTSLLLPHALKGRVSLLCVSFKQFGFVQLPSWHEPFAALAQQQDQPEAVEGPGKKKTKSGKKGAKQQQQQQQQQQLLQVVQVSVMDGGFIASLLKGTMKAGLFKATPPALHATSGLVVGEPGQSLLSEALSLENKLLGHALLVDQNAKVRFHGCGVATPEETEALARCVAELTGK